MDIYVASYCWDAAWSPQAEAVDYIHRLDPNARPAVPGALHCTIDQLESLARSLPQPTWEWLSTTYRNAFLALFNYRFAIQAADIPEEGGGFMNFVGLLAALHTAWAHNQPLVLEHIDGRFYELLRPHITDCIVQIVALLKGETSFANHTAHQAAAHLAAVQRHFGAVA